MKILYELSFETDRKESFQIGMFESRAKAQKQAARYLQTVPGFMDYFCIPHIAEIPCIEPAGNHVYRFCGWNWDHSGDEQDCIFSSYYGSRETAETEMALAREETLREEWTLDRYTIGQCDWAEGFAREYADGEKAPTLHEIRSILQNATETQSLTEILFRDEDLNKYMFPLAVSDELFLAAEDHDFQLDGFTVRRIRDVEKISGRIGLYEKIIKEEGLLDSLPKAHPDITNWETLFRDLKSRTENVIIEGDRDENTNFFMIGQILDAGSDSVTIRRFDADGIWDIEPQILSYADIFSVTFASRYIRIFSKYVR